ncbi:hypothetical protein R9X47_13790 [Wukongibacter baidiensis]|uniref:hypothetical protein n=1 Tax=Wukongibacter baidiensis TaxID=1723361 RepID=UPI003D7F6C9E
MSNRELQPHIIKEIDSFVKKLSRNIDANDIEISEFEEEMKSNLLCSLTDLLDEGYSESDALSLAFSKFGHIDYLKHDLRKLYNLRSIFSKALLKITVSMGIICAILFTTFFTWNFLIVPSKADNTFETLKNEIENIDDISSSKFKEKVNSLVDNNIAIYSISILETQDDTLSYQLLYRYPTPQSETYWKDDIGKESFFIFKDEHYSNNSDFDLSDLNYNVTLSLRNLDFNFLALAEIFLAIYWALFAVWGALDVYLNDDKGFWVMVFALTNIIGYMIYRYQLKQKKIL